MTTKTIVNKTDRVKLVSTQVVESTVIFHRTDTQAEFARIDVAACTGDMKRALLVYGAKQVCSDIAAGIDNADKKIEAIAAAVASLGAGTWPRRASAPASLEPAIAMIMAAQKCDRAQARQLLGMLPE